MKFPNLSKEDIEVAHKHIAKFLDGYIPMIAIPAWVMSGKRCKGINANGRCDEAVYGKDNHCCYCKIIQREKNRLLLEDLQRSRARSI